MGSTLKLLLLVLLTSPSLATLTSQNVSGQLWRGDAKVLREHKKVVVHATYLEIEEEVELAATEQSWGGIPSDATKNALEILGDFTLPHGSVLSGAILWDGDKLLKAKLKTDDQANSEYDSIVDHDWTWVPTPTDPLLIGLNRRHESGDIYEFKLFPVAWEGSRRLRIRYLVPLSYRDNVPTLVIPSVFAFNTNGVKPDSYTLELEGAEGIEKVRVTEGDYTATRYLSNRPLTLIQDYRTNDMRIELVGGDAHGLMSTTTVDSGALSGEYMHFYSALPQELFLNAGLKREVVFLWRWENENSFVEWRNGYKNLSEYGDKFYYQAIQIQTAAQKLLSEDAGVALVVDREKRDTTLEMAYRGTPEADALLDYVSAYSNNKGTIIAEFSGYEVEGAGEGDGLTKRQYDSLTQRGSEEFEIAISEVRSLFSPDERVIKHVVVLTVGKRRTDDNEDLVTDLEGFEDISMSFVGGDATYPDGYWPGVSMKSLAAEHKISGAGFYYGTYVPEIPEVSLTLVFASDQRNLALLVDEVQENTHLSFTGHAAGAWSDTVQWYIQDKQGNDLATYAQVPVSEESKNNSDLMMLWGGSSNTPYSETIKNGSVGALMGFVDEGYSLLALPTDTMSKDVQEYLEGGGTIANLTTEEIYYKEPSGEENSGDGDWGGVTPVAKDMTRVAMAPGLHGVRFVGNSISFSLNIEGISRAQLVVYDMKGRVIKMFDHNQLVGTTELVWNGLSGSGASLARGVYTARLSFDGHVETLRFIR